MAGPGRWYRASRGSRRCRSEPRSRHPGFVALIRNDVPYLDDPSIREAPDDDHVQRQGALPHGERVLRMHDHELIAHGCRLDGFDPDRPVRSLEEDAEHWKENVVTGKQKSKVFVQKHNFHIKPGMSHK